MPRVSMYVCPNGQNKGERGGTAFPHLLFSASAVPPPGFKC